MASTQSMPGFPSSSEDSVTRDGQFRVGRAAGLEDALPSQPWREHALVSADSADDRLVDEADRSQIRTAPGLRMSRFCCQVRAKGVWIEGPVVVDFDPSRSRPRSAIRHPRHVLHLYRKNL